MARYTKKNNSTKTMGRKITKLSQQHMEKQQQQ